MKARIEKKLSKKLLEIIPSAFCSPWLDSYEPSELAQDQGTSVSGVWSVGGGLSYEGEAEDSFTCYEDFRNYYYWLGDFPTYPEGHEFELLPNTGNFKPNGKNLIALARKIATQEKLSNGGE